MKPHLFITIFILFYTNLFARHIQFNWQNCFNGPLYDEAYNIAPTGNGYLIAGTYTIQINEPPIVNDRDVWLIKTDLAGNLQWQKFFGGLSGDGSARIFPAGDGNYFVVGGSVSSDGDISNDPYPASTDYWIIKVDSSGAILWYWKTVETFDISGKQGQKLWDVRKIDSGIYLYTLKVGTFNGSGKIVISK